MHQIKKTHGSTQEDECRLPKAIDTHFCVNFLTLNSSDMVSLQIMENAIER